jgi:hypothetical protein
LIGAADRIRTCDLCLQRSSTTTTLGHYIMSDKPLTQEEWEKPRAVPELTSIKRLTGEIVDLRAYPWSAEIAADV